MNTQSTIYAMNAMQNQSPLVLPVWIGQQGPVMTLAEVDEYPVVILSPMATQAEINAAVEALRAIKLA